MIICDFIKQEIRCNYLNGNDLVSKYRLTSDELFEMQLDFFIQEYDKKSTDFINDIENLYSIIELSEDKNKVLQ